MKLVKLIINLYNTLTSFIHLFIQIKSNLQRKRVYIVEQYICCAGNIRNKKMFESNECCGNNSYDVHGPKECLDNVLVTRKTGYKDFAKSLIDLVNYKRYTLPI